MLKSARDLFINPIQHQKQIFIYLFSSVLFIFVPQLPPSDWKLNTIGLFENFLSVYQNPNYVYPPWALIPLCLYRLIGSEGARILSVITIGLLCQQKRWSLFRFFTIVLSPFFLVTMTKSNIDILSYVLPVVIWEKFQQPSRYQFLMQVLAIYILLIKPQGALLLLPFLLIAYRVPIKRIFLLGIVILILTVPISLISQPPFLFQWLENILNPSPQNKFYWGLNNISITSKSYAIEGILVIVALVMILFFLAKKGILTWSKDHWISSLLFLSMVFSPYTSQQSLSSSLAFIPSWFSFLYQLIIVLVLSGTDFYFNYLSFLILSIFIISLITFKADKRSHEEEQ